MCTPPVSPFVSRPQKTDVNPFDSWEDDPVIEIPEDSPQIKSGEVIMQEAKAETLPETTLHYFLSKDL